VTERRVPYVTYAIIAANLIMFAVELARGADPFAPTVGDILPLGGNFAPLTLNGEWWRIGASMFLHYGLLHLAMNMLCLFQARHVEQLFGRLGYVAIYVAAGVLGGVGSAARSANVVSAGASGAVFGVFGAFAAYLIVRRGSYDPTEWDRRARTLASFIAINLVLGLRMKGIDMTAHVVGLATGFVVGAALVAGKHADAQRTFRAIAAAVGSLALAVAIVVAVPKPTDVEALLDEFGKVEHACVTAFSGAIEEAQQDKLTRSQLADRVERDTLVPWRAIHARVDAARPPPRLDRMFEILRSYLADRERAWDTFVRAYRLPETDPRGKALEDEFEQLAAKAAGDIDALDAESKHLKEP
jgi:rhomboid protease GluP